MILPENIRIDIADRIVRIVAPVMIISALIAGLGLFVLGEQQYHRFVPILIVFLFMFLAWIFALKGKPLAGIVIMLACLSVGVLAGMTFSGGIRAPVFVATLSTVTIFIVIFGTRGGVIFSISSLAFGALFIWLDTINLIPKVDEPPAIYYLLLMGVFIFMQLCFVLIPVRLMLKTLMESQNQKMELKIAIGDRQRSQQELQSILNRTPDIIYRLDPTGKVTFISDVVRNYGYTPEEFLGKPIINYVHQDDRQDVLQKLHERRSGDRGPKDLEIRFLIKKEKMEKSKKKNEDKNWLIFHISSEDIYTKTELGKNTYVGIQGIARDISKTRYYETQITQLAAAVEQAAEDVVITDTEGVIQYVNPKLETLTGYSKEDIIGKTPNIFKSGKHNQGFYADLWATIKNRNTWNGKIWNKIKDGRLILQDVAITPIIDSSDKVTGYASVRRDITEQHKASIELQNEKDFSEYLINSLPGIFFLYKLENEMFLLKRWNKNHETILGYSEIELKDATGESFFKKEDREKIATVIKNVINKGKESFEIELLRKDGSVITFYLQGVLFTESNSTFLMGTGIDLTEQKQIEKEKQVLITRLSQSQKMEAIGTLAGGIAHDFNNILSGIFGYSQLAQTNLDDPLKAKDQIAQIVKGAQRATELVQQILTFSRQTEYQKRPFKVYIGISEALKLIRSSIPSSIEIETNLNSRSMVIADPTKIHQVVMNLCTNAYHAMRATGGLLTVSLKDVIISEPLALIDKTIPTGQYVKMEVSDTGHGMDEKVLEKVFEPYYTTKKVGQGTGLGLALVQAIIDEHDSFCEVISEPAQGTSFFVYFPIVLEKINDNAPQIIQEFQLNGNETIMVVDDEIPIRESCKLLMENHGYQVQTFSNGIEALETFKSNPAKFDLIITDMTMPGLTGDKLAIEVLKIQPDLPIVLCTGFNENISQEETIELGIKKYVQKPLPSNDLMALVRELLDKNDDAIHP